MKKYLVWLFKFFCSRKLKTLNDSPYDEKSFGFVQQLEGKKVRVLYINEIIKENIQRMIKNAEANKIDINQMRKISEGLLPAVGYDANFTCNIEHGFKVVFSIEQQLDKNWYRHMSVSINDKSKLPSIPAVELLMQEFGFIGGIHDCDHVWIERNISPMAVNIIQKR